MALSNGRLGRTNKTYLDTESDLKRELRLWRVTESKIERDKTSAKVTIRFIPADGGDTVELTALEHDAAHSARKLFNVIHALRLLEARGFRQLVASYYEQSTAVAVRPEDAERPYEAYTALGVRPDASQEAIEGAYRGLLRRWHPDVAGPAGAAKTSEINAAYAQIVKLRGWR